MFTNTLNFILVFAETLSISVIPRCFNGTLKSSDRVWSDCFPKWFYQNRMRQNIGRIFCLNLNFVIKQQEISYIICNTYYKNCLKAKSFFSHPEAKQKKLIKANLLQLNFYILGLNLNSKNTNLHSFGNFYPSILISFVSKNYDSNS